MGSLFIDREPIVRAGLEASLEHYTDPLPQSLVLTAIVIGFATSALFLVVLLALRGLSGTDHVDGAEPTLPSPEANAGPASAFFQTYMPDADSTLDKEEDAAPPAPTPQPDDAGKAEESAAAPAAPLVLATDASPSIVLVAENAPAAPAAEAMLTTEAAASIVLATEAASPIVLVAEAPPAAEAAPQPEGRTP